MEMLPFYLGGFGLLVLSVLGLAYYQNERLKKKLVDKVFLQLREKLSLPDILQHLQRAGLQDAQALKIVEFAQQRIHIKEALNLLTQGITVEEARSHLIGTGLQTLLVDEVIDVAVFRKFCVDRPVIRMMLGIVLPLVGLAVMVIGLLLWLGNKSGGFVTFPFAGQLVMGIGVVILTFGLRFLMRSLSS